MDGKLNGIIIDGKVYVPTKSKTDNCKYCHLKPQETGVFHCIISNWCYDLGEGTIFRYSQKLTNKLNGKWPNPDFGTPVNPRIEALLDEIIQITTEDQKAK